MDIYSGGRLYGYKKCGGDLMGVNFGNVEKLVIPEGEVVMITSGETVLWQKQRKLREIM